MKRIYQDNLLKGILNHSMDAFIVIDSSNRIVEWNNNASNLFGWTEDEIKGQSIHKIVPNGLEKDTQLIINRRLEVISLHKNDNKIPVELTIIPVEIENDTFFTASFRDLTTKRQDLNELNRRARLINLSRDGIYVVDEKHHLVLWNQGAEALYGYTAEEALGKISYQLLKTEYPSIDSDDPNSGFLEIIKCLMKNSTWEGEIIQYTKYGERKVILSRWALDEEKKEVLVTNTDITQIKNHAERVEYLATHDELTGLPNRRLLDDRIYQAMALANRNNTLVGIMLLDLDRFKVVNDSLGHDQGDILLKEVASRLNQVVRRDDTVARLGGDEFVIILDNVTDANHISTIARKIIDIVCTPVKLGKRYVTVGTSVGVAVYPQDGDNMHTLLRHADLAMYEAKEQNVGAFRFFSEEMNISIQKRMINENDLRRALENNEFVLHYQPKICSYDGKTTGVEALIRWNHPTRGMIPPGEFIPLAEEMGLISKIGEWALCQALHQNKSWQDLGKSPIQMSVNLSVHQLVPGLVDMLERCLESSKLDPKWLDLEITESAAMNNVEETIVVLNRIRDLGISLSIDDFGTGYSSLMHLKKMPITCLKIDQSFVRGIPNDNDDMSIVRSIIALAHSMKLKVIAEGVTDREQVAFLDTMECDEMQGFLFSRPEEAELIENEMIDHEWKYPYNMKLISSGPSYCNKEESLKKSLKNPKKDPKKAS